MPKKPAPLEPLIPLDELKSVLAKLVAVPKDKPKPAKARKRKRRKAKTKKN